MFNKYIVVFLFSIILPYLSIEDGKVYDNKLKKHYDHDQFIEFMSIDSTFFEIKDYNQQGLNLSFGLTYNKQINLGIASYIQNNKIYFTPVFNIEIY